MIAEMREGLQPYVSAILGHDVELTEPVLLAGGAPKEAWSVDADGEPLLVPTARRELAGAIRARRRSPDDIEARLRIASPRYLEAYEATAE
jgi:hypothetical protein